MKYDFNPLGQLQSLPGQMAWIQSSRRASAPHFDFLSWLSHNGSDLLQLRSSFIVDKIVDLQIYFGFPKTAEDCSSDFVQPCFEPGYSTCHRTGGFDLKAMEVIDSLRKNNYS